MHGTATTALIYSWPRTGHALVTAATGLHYMGKEGTSSNALRIHSRHAALPSAV